MGRAPKPVGDSQPNDVYGRAPRRFPVLSSQEIVIYPHHLGFEYGQDPEHSIYEVQNAVELVAQHGADETNKHGTATPEAQPSHRSSQQSTAEPAQFRPRPSFPPAQPTVHP